MSKSIERKSYNIRLEKEGFAIYETIDIATVNSITGDLMGITSGSINRITVVRDGDIADKIVLLLEEDWEN